MKNEKKTKEQLIGELVEMRQRVAELEALETERKQALALEKNLGESEKMYREFYDNAPDMFVSVDAQTAKIIQCNQTLATTLGYTKEEIIGRHISEMYHPDSEEDRKKVFHSFVSRGEVHDAELQLKRKDGSKIEVGLNVTAVRDEQGNVIYSRSIWRDITKRKQAEQSLLESEERYSFLYNNTPVMMHSIDRKGQLISVNNYWLEKLGYDRREVIGRKSTEFLTEASRRYAQGVTLPQFFKIGFSQNLEFQMVKKTGEVIDVLLSSTSRKDEAGKIISTLAFIIDVTERKKVEEKIKASLREKEVLLKEVHHRVKNNLQVISSLINLQARYTTDEQLLQTLKEIQNRIQSMAFVHEKLYQSKDIASVDMSEYIQSLTAYLYQTYGAQLTATTLKSNVDDIFLDIDTAVPCGLILNELVSNALKHAFPAGWGVQPPHNRMKGEVRIDFHSDTDNQLTLTVSDNGVGLPQDLDFRKAESLGLRLVVMLTEQLDGTIELDRSDGTKFEITFPMRGGRPHA